jgi:hypothetical protein
VAGLALVEVAVALVLDDRFEVVDVVVAADDMVVEAVAGRVEEVQGGAHLALHLGHHEGEVLLKALEGDHPPRPTLHPDGALARGDGALGVLPGDLDGHLALAVLALGLDGEAHERARGQGYLLGLAAQHHAAFAEALGEGGQKGLDALLVLHGIELELAVV